MTRRRVPWAWLAVAATLLAALLRLYHLGSLPPQAWVDEAWYNLRARDLALTGDFHIFYPTFWGGMHPLMVDLAAVAHALGLHSLVASRIVAALGGILTIPLAFAATNELWRGTGWPAQRRRLTAALTAVILAGLFYLILASRIGYAPMLIPPVMLFYLWQTRWAQRTESWLGWAAAGMALGAAQYLNLNGRFLIPLAVVFGLHDLLVAAPGRRRVVVAGLSAAALTAVVVALPLIAFFIREPQWLLARAGHIAGDSGSGPGGWLWANALRIAASLNFRGDPNPRHNLPGRPLLDAFQSIGLWVGLAWCARHFRRLPAARELLAWLGLMTLSSLITDDAPQFERMIGVGIPAAALVAVGWVEAWQWLRSRLAPGVRGWVMGGAVLAVVWVGLSTGLGVYDFFVRYPRTPGLAQAMTSYPVDLAHALIQRAESEAVFVERLTEADDVYAFDFLFPGTHVRRLDFRQCLPLTDRRAAPTTYLVYDERDPRAADRLQQAYPQLTITLLDPDPATLMDPAVLLEVPAGASAPLFEHAAHARFASGLRLLGYEASATTVAAGESVFVTLYWKVEAAPGDKDLTAFAHLAGPDPAAPLVAQSDHAPCQGLYPPALWQPGDVIPDGFAITIPTGTPAGRYPLAIGWYEQPSLQRLTLVEADSPLSDDRALLTEITVTRPQAR